MSKTLLPLSVPLLAVTLGLLASPLKAEEPPPAAFFTLAGGDISGNYFAVARAVCREINRRHVGQMRWSPESTAGSGYNLEALLRGDVDYAIVQSDMLAAARDSDGAGGSTGRIDDLRGIVTLYGEAIIVLLAPGRRVSDLTDLVGLRVDVGPHSAGRRASLDRILAKLGLDVFDFAEVSELPASAAVDELCEDRLDAIVLVVGNPDRNVGRALSDCGATILPLGQSPSAAVINSMGAYERVVVPAGLYPELPADLVTFGVKALLVTRSVAPDDQVLALGDVLGNDTASLDRAAPVLMQDASHDWPEGAAVPVHPALSPG